MKKILYASLCVIALVFSSSNANNNAQQQNQNQQQNTNKPSGNNNGKPNTGNNGSSGNNNSNNSSQSNISTGKDLSKIYGQQKNPGEFQTQEIMQNMFGGQAADRASSGDISNMVDGKITNIKHPGIQSFVDVKRSGVIDKAVKAATQSIGNTAVTTGRAYCYIARGQSFYNYQCSLNGVSYGSPDNGNSPTKAKQACEKNCYTAGRCYEVKSAKDTNSKDTIEKLGKVTFNKDNTKPFEVTRTITDLRKAKGITFKIKSNAPVLFFFEYTDESGYKRVMANGTQITATGEEEDKNQNGNSNNGNTGKPNQNNQKPNTGSNSGGNTNGKPNQNNKKPLQQITKSYALTQKVKDLKLGFQVEEKYKKQEDLLIEIQDIELVIPKTKRFACSSQNLYFKDEKRKNCAKSDRVLLQSPEGPIEICKAFGSGDNDDGTFSTEEGCRATCRTNGECLFKNPSIDAAQFFGFQEGCLTDSKSCSNTGCRTSREQDAPILNEKVYDGEGNVTETIKNGIAVPGTIRPRVMADASGDYNNKIQQETKSLAFANMVKNQSYNASLPLNQKRETSYAIRTEANKTADGKPAIDKKLFVRVKPSDTLYDNPAYLYVMVRVESVSKDLITLPPCDYGQLAPDTPEYNKRTEECKKRDSTFRSYHYFLLDENKQAKGFYRHQGFNRGEYINNGNRYQVFNGKKWVEGGEGNSAPVFKRYNDLLGSVKKNKYFLEEEITNNSYAFLEQIKGLPKVRAYWNAAGGGEFIIDPNTGKPILRDPFRAMLGEIYVQVKTKADIPAEIIAQNNGKEPKLKGYETPNNYVVYALLSDKELTHREIAEELIVKEKTTAPTHAIYNLLEIDNKNLLIDLKSDGTMGEEIVKIYLVGNSKQLSAYANVTSREPDVGENGYLFYWWHDAKADPAKGSITNLKPDSQEIREFKQFMPATLTDYEIFADKDFSKNKTQSLKFGYGAGDYDAKADCKVMNTTSGKSERICLPWWRIEREYDEKKDKSIANADFRALMGKMKLPMQGKVVSVCTKVDPMANAIYNKERQTITCTSYYNMLAGEDCFQNPFQKKCFYDNCPVKVKENCTLTNTIGFGDLKTKVQVDDVTAAGGDINQLKETKLEVKTYGYKCPKTINIDLNQVCLKEETVMMQPAVCQSAGNTGGTGGGSGGAGGGNTGGNGNTGGGNNNAGGNSGSGQTPSLPGLDAGDAPTEHATMDEILSGKSNVVYCNTGNPVIDASGALKGFRGTCPGTRQEVTCKFDSLQTTTKTCTDPIIQKVKEEKINNVEQERVCKDVYVNVAKGETDIYKDDPSCYRSNTAADSKKGTISVNFRQDVNVTGLLISKNKESQQSVEFCTYNGTQGKMQGNCTSNSGQKTLNFISTLKDSQEILFAEQITRTDGGEDLGGWSKNLGIDATYEYGTGGKNDAMHGEICYGVGVTGGNNCYNVQGIYQRGTPEFEKAQKDNPNATWNAVGDIVPGKLLGSSNEYSSTAVSASVGSNRIEMLPDLRTPNFQLRWRSCGAPNIDEPDFNEVLSNGYFATKGYWRTGAWTLHLHSYRWRVYGYHDCDGHKSVFNSHWSHHNISKVNLFLNSGAGLSILFPTPSNYEVYFFNTEGGLMHKEVIAATKMTTNLPGQMTPIRLGDKAKLYENGQETNQRLSCSEDDLSPAGGGTMYGIHSTTGAVCPVARDRDFILKNSIGSVTIIDLDTKITTTKKLTYPLPYINRIYYGYAQSVESRRYSCCQDFN